MLKAAIIVKKLRHGIQGLRLAVGRQRAEYEKSEQVLESAIRTSERSESEIRGQFNN